MTEKVYIEIDASSWMDEDGIFTSVWLGDTCEPSYEARKSYEELVDQELYSHTVRDKLIDKNIDEAEKFVFALEKLAVYARKRFEELQDEK